MVCRVGEKMFEDIIENMSGDFDIKPMDVMNLQPLVLAYIGDAVYEVYIRNMLVVNKKANVNMLHKMSVKYVKAKAQVDILHRISDKLTADEQDIVRRGRNAKSATVPKHADVTDYRYSTGFEALIGYLYLLNNTERLMEVLRLAVEE
jgi:ribonuclease-3 family protein